MYRPPSPVYDVPELPTLRRVKPLPKRRRTSGSAPHDHLDSAAIPGSGGGGTPDLTANSTTSTNTPALGQQDADGHTTAQDGEDGLPPSTPDLDGHATTPPDTLTAQMALQAYYMPVLGGVRDLFKASPPDSRASTPLDLSSALAGLGTGLSSGNGYGYGYSYGYGGGGMPGAYMDGRDGGDDDESGEGDYVDHLQQPGNTKKRKVPANMSGSAHGHDSGSTGSGAEDEPADRAIPTGRERDAEAGSVGVGGGGGLGGGGGTGVGGGTTVGLSLSAQAALGRSGGGLGGGRRGRLTRATFAGLQHKEMLRSRKRQLAAVLGALAHGDTLALDQALSASYPFVQTGIDYRSGAPVRVRLSRRREARLARAYKAYKEALAVDQPGHTDSPADAEAEVASEKKKDSAKSSPSKPGKQKQQTKSQTQAARDRQVQEQPQPLPSAAATTTPPPKVPSSEFSFVCHSATSDRLVATKEEVAQLHSRFEEELARQAAKAAEAAKQAAAAAAGSSGPNGPVAKRTDRTKQGAAGSGKAGGAGGDGKADPAQPGGAGAGTGTKSGGKSGKKKKRSALANASNPHHLRNYVPTRLPHSGPPNAQQAAQNAQNLLSPPPLRFLSAEIPPRRPRKKGTAAGAGAGAGAGAPASAPAPVAPATTLTNPAEEWICPFCEYQLFYGDESSYHRAVRNRKKILRRRRRARERAAAAASGVAPAAPASAAASTGGEKGEHEDAVLDAPVAAVREPAPSPGKAAKWKEGDRGGRGVQAAAHA